MQQGPICVSRDIVAIPEDYKLLGGGSFIKPLIFSELCVAFRNFIFLVVVNLMAKIQTLSDKTKTFPRKYINFYDARGTVPRHPGIVVPQDA